MWLTSLEISAAEAHILLKSCSDTGVLMFLCPLTEAPFRQSLCQLDRESKSVLRPRRFLSNLPRAVRRGGERVALQNNKGFLQLALFALKGDQTAPDFPQSV